MCFAQVGRVVALDGAAGAIVDVDGRRRPVSLAALVLDGTTPRPGDWLLIHTGFALDVLDPADAADIAALGREIRAAGREDP
ncbi:MAG TPA: HypC/HybG/HupF family hydrogenase formation chaperone [Acidimicrobiales bacterium]|nr:HypC/HybG/HupF family hydrogenase formation chaperone [Acidimicrobiales bacterium]